MPHRRTLAIVGSAAAALTLRNRADQAVDAALDLLVWSDIDGGLSEEGPVDRAARHERELNRLIGGAGLKMR